MVVSEVRDLCPQSGSLIWDLTLGTGVGRSWKYTMHLPVYTCENICMSILGVQLRRVARAHGLDHRAKVDDQPP